MSRPVSRKDPELHISGKCRRLCHGRIDGGADERVFGHDCARLILRKHFRWQVRTSENKAIRAEAISPTPDLARQRELVEMRPLSSSSMRRSGPRVPAQCNCLGPKDPRTSMVLRHGLPVRDGRVPVTEVGMRSVRRRAVARRGGPSAVRWLARGRRLWVPMCPRARQYSPVRPLAWEPRLEASARPGLSTRSAHTAATPLWALVRDPAAARAAAVRFSAVRSVVAGCREALD